MENLHTIKVTYVSPTNFRGARVKLTSERFKSSKTINFDYEVANIYNMAKDWLESKGVVCGYMSEGKSCYMIHSNTFVDISKL